MVEESLESIIASYISETNTKALVAVFSMNFDYLAGEITNIFRLLPLAKLKTMTNAKHIGALVNRSEGAFKVYINDCNDKTKDYYINTKIISVAALLLHSSYILKKIAEEQPCFVFATTSGYIGIIDWISYISPKLDNLRTIVNSFDSVSISTNNNDIEFIANAIIEAFEARITGNEKYSPKYSKANHEIKNLSKYYIRKEMFERFEVSGYTASHVDIDNALIDENENVNNIREKYRKGKVKQHEEDIRKQKIESHAKRDAQLAVIKIEAEEREFNKLLAEEQADKEKLKRKREIKANRVDRSLKRKQATKVRKDKKRLTKQKCKCRS
jgi:hypothetical protein